ncbi:ATP-binding protein [Luteibacter sp. 329MFSha]|uniref:sensor histidine kinase n=1 Tax=Luteibacter sp. 329MFSha TaxID=1798239 RepID=UPI0008B7CE61|nr:ATP-binding protein [Luteibacter sp. 329MFSha]SEV89864.1 Histidine kinase-, DNA gyrase B-, and HSP90-like ATPase [Luteibacter sp. 329MFSha]
MPVVRPAIAWLKAAPVTDPIDARHAPAIQFLLLFMMVTLPLNWAYHLFLVRTPVRPDMVVDLGVDVMVWTTALLCVRLIRQGRLRRAVQWFVTAMLVALAIMYLSIGLTRQMLDQTYPVLTIVLGGLILGRRSLWTIYALIVLMMWGGGIVDVVHLTARNYPRPWLGAANAPSMSMSYFVITLVLDRCVWAMRAALEEARKSGAELLSANAALRAEMQARERAQEMTLYAHRMETVGRLSGGIAHDVNHLVAIVEGAAERSHAVDEPRELRALIRDIGSAATRARELVRRLTAFARRGGDMPESFDATQAIDDIRPVLRQIFPAAVTLDVDASAASMVWMDRSHFDLALINVATNARDAMGASGRFVVHVGHRRRGDIMGVSVTLTDSGPGMTEAILRRACEPFFTTKAPGKGTGLGLAMVKDMLVRNGGDLAIRSAPGAGTTVELWLPERVEDRPLATVRVMVVESDDARRDAMSTALEDMGCIVVAVAGTGEASTILEHIADDLDLILASDTPEGTGHLVVIAPRRDVAADAAARMAINAFRSPGRPAAA